MPSWHGAELCIKSILPNFIIKKLAHRIANGSSNIMEEGSLSE
jgi:hypothetical protein